MALPEPTAGRAAGTQSASRAECAISRIRDPRAAPRRPRPCGAWMRSNLGPLPIGVKPRHAPASAREAFKRGCAITSSARRDTDSFRTVLEQVPADAWGCQRGRTAEGTPKPANYPSIEA